MMLSEDLLARSQSVRILEKLFDAGVFVPAVGYPAVVEGKARLRVPRTRGNKLLRVANIFAEGDNRSASPSSGNYPTR